VGDGDEAYREELRAIARAHGCADRVDLEPGRDRAGILQAYAEADAVLFPVEWDEPWGLVPLEAMGRGRPVVATGRGGSGEYLRDTENCLLFEAGDPQDLASKVRRLAEDPDLRARLRERGFATAAAHSEDAFNAEALRLMQRAAADNVSH
jgi:D-inositol-3-phosphate glycosyltransferase